MFVRTGEKHKKKTYQGANNPDELFNALKAREKHTIDHKGKDPINLFLSGLTPVFYAVLIAMLLSVFSIRQPDPQIYGGKVVPANFVKPGAILSNQDSMTQSKNYTLTFPAGGDSTIMMVWDYAEVDMDSISILIDGAPMGDDVRLTNATKVFRVPKGGDVRVIGTFDGGGGITYGVYFPEIKKSIINGLGRGEVNTYSLRAAQ